MKGQVHGLFCWRPKDKKAGLSFFACLLEVVGVFTVFQMPLLGQLSVVVSIRSHWQRMRWWPLYGHVFREAWFPLCGEVVCHWQRGRQCVRKSVFLCMWLAPGAWHFLALGLWCCRLSPCPDVERALGSVIQIHPGVTRHCHEDSWWTVLLWYCFVCFDVVLVLEKFGNLVFWWQDVVDIHESFPPSTFLLNHVFWAIVDDWKWLKACVPVCAWVCMYLSNMLLCKMIMCLHASNVIPKESKAVLDKERYMGQEGQR